MEIIERIFLIMKQKNLKNKDLEEKLNINSSTVSTWKSKTKNPPVEYMEGISNLLDVSLDYLITGRETPQIPYTEDETKIVNFYRNCNHTGKQRIMIYAEDTFKLYKEQKGKLSDLRIG